MSNTNDVNLRLTSYNCNSIRKKIDIIRLLLKSCDVLVLQEIILVNDDLGFIYSIDDQFDLHVMPSKCPISENLEGRPSGGLAIFWRKSLNIDVEMNTVHDNFMLVTITCGSWSVGLANVYMPHDDRSRDVISNYSQILGELHASIDELDTGNIICIGDFNADPTRGRLWESVSGFCESNNFSVSDLIIGPDTFSYLSPSHNTTSWIDHILTAGDVNLIDIEVQYNVAVFDHFPLSTNIIIDNNCVAGSVDHGTVPPDKLLNSFIDWV